MTEMGRAPAQRAVEASGGVSGSGGQGGAETLSEGRVHWSTRYDFAATVDGEWHLWRDVANGVDGEPGEDRETSTLLSTRVRVAALSWGKARGLRAESSRQGFGRVLWLRFVPR